MTASKSGIASDLAKVDAYENTAADYEEIPEITDEEFARAVRHKNGVPVRGRPPLGDRPKKSITLRLDPMIIEHYRSLGPGWQGKINDALARSVSRAKRKRA